MRRKLTISITAILAIYCVSYLGLSFSGAYIPDAVGTNGVKSWIWAPCGFAYKSGRFPTVLGFGYLPLWWCDIHFWHSDRTGQSGPRRLVGLTTR